MSCRSAGIHTPIRIRISSSSVWLSSTTTRVWRGCIQPLQTQPFSIGNCKFPYQTPLVWRGCMQPLQTTRLLSSTTGSGGVAYNPSRHSCFLLETANSLTKNPLSGGVVYNPSSPAWSCCEAGPGLIGMSLGILYNDIQQQSRAEPSRSRPMQTKAEQSQAEQ